MKPNHNNGRLFTFLSLILICSGLIMDELSTRIALLQYPEQIFETNKFTVYLMANNLWFPFDLVVSLFMWMFSVVLYYTVKKKMTGWIVGGSASLIYGGFRLLAGIHNIQLILGCMK